MLASQDYWTNFKKSPLTIKYADDELENADRYGKWHDYCLDKCCPDGSIEFCNKYGIKTLPRNIPLQLKDYACGLVATCRAEMKDSTCLWHVKSSNQIKHQKNSTYSVDNIPFEDGEFQVVE